MTNHFSTFTQDTADATYFRVRKNLNKFWFSSYIPLVEHHNHTNVDLLNFLNFNIKVLCFLLLFVCFGKFFATNKRECFSWFSTEIVISHFQPFRVFFRVLFVYVLIPQVLSQEKCCKNIQKTAFFYCPLFKKQT